MVDSTPMTKQLTTIQQRGLLDIAWAIVLLQGGFLVLSTIESLVANATQGFALIAITLLTAGAATLTLLATRGLRRHKGWARRLTVVGEWFTLALGSVELVATQSLDPSGVDIVPLVTGIVMPLSVLVLLRRAKGLFSLEPSIEIDEEGVEMEVAA